MGSGSPVQVSIMKLNNLQTVLDGIKRVVNNQSKRYSLIRQLYTVLVRTRPLSNLTYSCVCAPSHYRERQDLLGATSD